MERPGRLGTAAFAVLAILLPAQGGFEVEGPGPSTPPPAPSFLPESAPPGGCSEVRPLHDPSVHGLRKIQELNPFCFSFALGHVLSVLTGKEANPLDIVRKLHAGGVGGPSGGVSPRDAGYALDLALAGGVCGGGIGPESRDLMRALGGEETFRLLMAETGMACEGARYGVGGLAPFYIGFGERKGLNNADFPAAMAAADALLEKGVPLVLNVGVRMLSRSISGGGGAPGRPGIFPLEDILRLSVQAHSLAVIGRRKDPRTGECQYLLLDSVSVQGCREWYDYDLESGEKDCGRGLHWMPAGRIRELGKSLAGYYRPRDWGLGGGS